MKRKVKDPQWWTDLMNAAKMVTNEQEALDVLRNAAAAYAVQLAREIFLDIFRCGCVACRSQAARWLDAYEASGTVVATVSIDKHKP